jgi:hypothetical protein
MTSGPEPVFAGAGDHDLDLLEARTLDGRTQDLVHRPTLRPGRPAEQPDAERRVDPVLSRSAREQSHAGTMAPMDRQQRTIGAVALGVAGLLAVVVVVGVVRALGPGSWVLASSASVLMAAAVSQWAALRARGRGGRLLPGELALLVALGVLGLTLSGLDYVTGDRASRGFTVLFAAGLIVVVGGVVGTYRLSAPGTGHDQTGT